MNALKGKKGMNALKGEQGRTLSARSGDSGCGPPPNMTCKRVECESTPTCMLQERKLMMMSEKLKKVVHVL